MYKEKGFHEEFGRFFFLPSYNSPKVSWMDAYWICRGMWAAFFVPLTQSEWEWMKQIAAENYEGMWLGLQEMKEDSNSYMWLGVTVTLGGYNTADNHFVGGSWPFNQSVSHS